jgi:hypothetical protein
MLNRTGLSLLAALALVAPAVAIAGVAGPLDDPTGVLSASDDNQTGDDTAGGALQEEPTPVATPEADDADDGQDDADATPIPDAATSTPNAVDDDALEAADEQAEANDVDDGEVEDADDVEAEDADDGEVEDADD